MYTGTAYLQGFNEIFILAGMKTETKVKIWMTVSDWTWPLKSLKVLSNGAVTPQ